jgi:chromosome segregation ATPase
MSTLDERLERLVAITEYNVQQISGLRSTTENHTDQIIENTRQISDLRSSVASLVQVSERQQETLNVYRQNFEAVMGRLQQVGDEIRGLQTENRRILDQLINRGENQ